MKDKEKKIKFKNKIKMREYSSPNKILNNPIEEFDRCHVELAFIYGKLIRNIGNKNDINNNFLEIICNMGWFLKNMNNSWIKILNMENYKVINQLNNNDKISDKKFSKKISIKYENYNLKYYLNEYIIYFLKFLIIIINYYFKIKNFNKLEKYINLSIIFYKKTKITNNINIIRIQTNILLSINKYIIYNKQYSKAIEIYFKCIDLLYIEICEIELKEQKKLLKKKNKIKLFIRKNKCYKRIILIIISLYYIYIGKEEYKKAYESLKLLNDLYLIFKLPNDDLFIYIENMYNSFINIVDDIFIKENIFNNIILKIGSNYEFVNNIKNFKENPKKIRNNNLVLNLFNNEKKKNKKILQRSKSL